MKKIFIEPEMKKIELNLRENIASSSGGKYILMTFMDSAYCMIINTRIPVGTVVDDSLVTDCIYLVPPKIGGTVAVPLAEMREYIR